jgi:hypothetical protein
MGGPGGEGTLSQWVLNLLAGMSWKRQSRPRAPSPSPPLSPTNTQEAYQKGGEATPPCIHTPAGEEGLMILAPFPQLLPTNDHLSSLPLAAWTPTRRVAVLCACVVSVCCGAGVCVLEAVGS